MKSSYTVKPVQQDGSVTDVQVLKDGKVWHLRGRYGARQARERVAGLHNLAGLPVLLGAGFGDALAALLESASGPVAVVDKEDALCAASGVRARFAHETRITWIKTPQPQEALRQLTRWQMAHHGLPFSPCTDPFYLRLDPAYYGFLEQHVSASQQADFWTRVRYRKFADSVPRILFLTSTYFLTGEIQAACTRLGYATSFVQLPGKELGTQEFVERILHEIVRFQPDFLLTINHLGVDKEGVLTDLLARLEVPLASWFVDNPHLILYLYENLHSDWVSIFTWDADNLPSLRSQGFSSVHYLPLGTDPGRFVPKKMPAKRAVSFVGNSMLYKVQAKTEHYAFPEDLRDSLEEFAQGFAVSGTLSVGAFLQVYSPQAFARFCALPDLDTRLAYETMLTWHATLLYRLHCVRELLSFEPVIAGDSGWLELLPSTGWKHQRELNYYADLPRWYPGTAINFNCTSQQMKGAVNQRVFDVPACGAFLLTDARWQMEELFEPDREVICFKDKAEIPELVRYYLKNPVKRQQIATQARRRVLAEHSYDHRLRALVLVMQKQYSSA